MRVLIIHQSTEMYGSDRSILGLIRFLLEKKNFKVTVLLPNDCGLLVDELASISGDHSRNLSVKMAPVIKLSQSTVTFKGMFKFLFDNFSGIFYLLRNRKEFKQFDLVHSNTVAVFLGVWVKILFRTKHIWNVREIVNQPKLLSTTIKYVVKTFSDFTVSNSKETNEWISSGFDAQSYAYINNGVDSAFNETPDACLKFNEFLEKNNMPIVLTIVGRISLWKGQNVAVKALQRIRDEGFNAVLVIVGDCHEDSLEVEKVLHDNIHRLKLTEFVFHTGFLVDPSSYYNLSDVVLVPSTKPEPFGRVAVEAMSCGKLVVASDHGGLSSIIQHQQNGLLVRPGCVESLSDSVIEVLSGKYDLDNIRENATLSYLHKFTSNICYSKYSAKYQEVVSAET